MSTLYNVCGESISLVHTAYGIHKYDGKIAGLYDLEETLGHGHFAVVKQARHVFTGEKVAVKVIDKSKLDDISRTHLFQEVRCMKLVQHPNVVRLYEVIDTATKLYLIMELGDGGDLYDYIMRHDGGLAENLARTYFAQILCAISYCHGLHVVHRDLKPENVVFFEKTGVVKVTDFGFSNKFNPGQKLDTSCGSLAYSAPEILLGDSYDAPAVDIWSLGVILYMLVCGRAPFQEANDSETLTMIMDCKYRMPNHVSSDCCDLIARMLTRDPVKRSSLTHIAKHPWLRCALYSENITTELPSNDQFCKENISVGALVMPLVCKSQLSDDDHNLIVQKMIAGNIATIDDIQDSLTRNAYNHITATYYLLAERQLRGNNRQIEKMQSDCFGKSPSNTEGANDNPCNRSFTPDSNLLTPTREFGELKQGTRKCSIVHEDEEDQEDQRDGDLFTTSCVRKDYLHSIGLYRRGSQSEGRINKVLQERIMVEGEPKKSSMLDQACPKDPFSASESNNSPTSTPSTIKFKSDTHTAILKHIDPHIILHSSKCVTSVNNQKPRTDVYSSKMDYLVSYTENTKKAELYEVGNNPKCVNSTSESDSPLEFPMTSNLCKFCERHKPVTNRDYQDFVTAARDSTYSSHCEKHSTNFGQDYASMSVQKYISHSCRRLGTNDNLTRLRQSQSLNRISKFQSQHCHSLDLPISVVSAPYTAASQPRAAEVQTQFSDNTLTHQQHKLQNLGSRIFQNIRKIDAKPGHLNAPLISSLIPSNKNNYTKCELPTTSKKEFPLHREKLINRYIQLHNKLFGRRSEKCKSSTDSYATTEGGCDFDENVVIYRTHSCSSLNNITNAVTVAQECTISKLKADIQHHKTATQSFKVGSIPHPFMELNSIKDVQDLEFSRFTARNKRHINNANSYTESTTNSTKTECCSFS